MLTLLLILAVLRYCGVDARSAAAELLARTPLRDVLAQGD
jgi:hypothetical protein